MPPIATRFRVLGVHVDAVQLPDVIDRMESWILDAQRTHFVVVSNVHVVMEARHDASFRKVLDSADLVVPDGMPLVWLGRLRVHRLQHRVAGPDLLLAFCRETQEKWYAHFFYGGAPGVPQKLAEELCRRFPKLKVVGTYSPSFLPLTQEEDTKIVEMINRAAPSVLWVGLGCPKQERWIFEHSDRLKVPVVAGIGQAFDIHTHRTRRAPRWMCEHGLEWLFRLGQDPRRLWRRYLLYNTQFIGNVCLEFLGLKEFD